MLTLTTCCCTLQLIVNLIDVNNHAPVFPLEMYVAQDVREDIPEYENILEREYWRWTQH